MAIKDFDARKEEDRDRMLKVAEGLRNNGRYDWTCGHKAGAVCAECHQELIRRANALAEENLALRERLARI